MFSISLVSILFIVSLIRSIISLWGKGAVVADLRLELEQKQKEQNELKKQFEHVQSTDFIEKQAREKLNLQRVGEVVVVLPKDLPQASQSAASFVNVPPNWQKWWKLFF